MRSLLNNVFKKPILAAWAEEVEYHQRRLYQLMVEMDNLEVYDEEIWQACFDTISHKKRI